MFPQGGGGGSRGGALRPGRGDVDLEALQDAFIRSAERPSAKVTRSKVCVSCLEVNVLNLKVGCCVAFLALSIAVVDHGCYWLSGKEWRTYNSKATYLIILYFKRWILSVDMWVYSCPMLAASLFAAS